MKKYFLSLISSLLILSTYSQIISPKVSGIINSIRSVNELNYDDVKENGKKTSQFFNYQQLLSNASQEELLFFAEDSNEIVKAYVYLALLDKQDQNLERFYVRSVQNEEKVVSNPKGIYTEILLHDFLRSKIYDKIEAPNYVVESDTFYNKMNSRFDSILIMDYKWNQSDVFIDHIIESAANDKTKLSKRKRWLANSYFEHKIAKKDDSYLFGRKCGFPATMPYLRSIVEKSMKDTLMNRVDYFDKWISCDLLVLKVYGAEALIRLQNEGKELTPYQIKVITELKSSFKSVQMCMNYYRERKPVKWALKDYELKDFAAN
ncbi:MAG: hypothetical protein ABF242_10045 [Flavobacteriales bacterium]